MKLSERLGAVEAEQEQPEAPANRRCAGPEAEGRAPADATPPPRPPIGRRRRQPPAEQPAPAKRTNAGWEDTKKRVRDLVLADLGPRLTGPKRSGAELEKEVKAALDRDPASGRTSASPRSSVASSWPRCSPTSSVTARSTRRWPTRPSPRSCATPTTRSGSSAGVSSSRPTCPSPTRPSTGR